METILPAENEPIIQDFIVKYKSQYAISPRLSICLIKLVMKVYFNQVEDFRIEEEKRMLKFKQSISNTVLNNDTMVEEDKCKLQYRYCIRDNIEDRNLSMGRDQIMILAYILKHEILVIHIKIKNGKIHIFRYLHTPRRDTILISYEYLICFVST